MQVMKWTRVHIGTQPNLKIIYSSPPCRVGQKTIWSNVIQPKRSHALPFEASNRTHQVARKVTMKVQGLSSHYGPAPLLLNHVDTDIQQMWYVHPLQSQ